MAHLKIDLRLFAGLRLQVSKAIADPLVALCPQFIDGSGLNHFQSQPFFQLLGQFQKSYGLSQIITKSDRKRFDSVITRVVSGNCNYCSELVVASLLIASADPKPSSTGIARSMRISPVVRGRRYSTAPAHLGLRSPCDPLIPTQINQCPEVVRIIDDKDV